MVSDCEWERTFDVPNGTAWVEGTIWGNVTADGAWALHEPVYFGFEVLVHLFPSDRPCIQPSEWMTFHLPFDQGTGDADSTVYGPIAENATDAIDPGKWKFCMENGFTVNMGLEILVRIGMERSDS